MIFIHFDTVRKQCEFCEEVNIGGGGAICIHTRMGKKIMTAKLGLTGM